MPTIDSKMINYYACGAYPSIFVFVFVIKMFVLSVASLRVFLGHLQQEQRITEQSDLQKDIVLYS